MATLEWVEQILIECFTAHVIQWGVEEQTGFVNVLCRYAGVFIGGRKMARSNFPSMDYPAERTRRLSRGEGSSNGPRM